MPWQHQVYNLSCEESSLSMVGDPNGSEVQNTGYGVYWPPIKNAAAHFGGTVTQAGPGIAPGTVYGAVTAGHPVIVWVTYDLAAQEHAMVVTGVSSTAVRVNDPDRSQYWVSRSVFETAYAVYGQMAVVFG